MYDSLVTNFGTCYTIGYWYHGGTNMPLQQKYGFYATNVVTKIILQSFLVTMQLV